MYSVKELDGIWWVIHNESGTQIPYNYGKTPNMTQDEIPYFTEWYFMSRRERKMMKSLCVAKEKLNEAATPRTETIKILGCDGTQWFYSTSAYLAEDFSKPVEISLVHSSDNKEEEKETTMTYDPRKEAFEHLAVRARSIRNAKEKTLMRKYGMVNDDPPSTFEEFITRIKEGKYTFMGKDPKEPTYYPFDLLAWRTVERDADGFKKASKVLMDAWDNLIDQLYLKTPEEAYKDLKEFEATEFA